ncbi:MAG TPA: signal peptidase II, partial [Candidatus Atribacteria bacterium]|nr:signal peptidase II [Candidatus Atribacteria bacterium]
MDKKSVIRLVTEFALIVVLIAVDQISKRLVDIYIPLGNTVPLWEGVFHLTSVHNKGAAFGMLAGSFWFLVAVRIIASMAMAFLLV